VAWIASGVGLLLFLGSVGILGYEGLFNSGGDPAISLSVERLSHDGRRWHAAIRAENSGGTTGARVQVVGELVSGTTVLETARAEFDYLPAGSTQRGGLFFDRDPAAHELRLRVLGYASP
jgi:uncharacterized protein (TIGR02588 family)